jgi:hypothetical protein
MSEGYAFSRLPKLLRVSAVEATSPSYGCGELKICELLHISDNFFRNAATTGQAPTRTPPKFLAETDQTEKLGKGHDYNSLASNHTPVIKLVPLNKPLPLQIISIP